MLLCSLLLAANAATAERIALHAQSMSRLHGWVAGSEVTTRGLQAALVSMGHQAEVFAPFFRRDRLAQQSWDLLLIEGYSGTATRAIRTVRRGNPRALVLHWCLDTYPRLAAVAALPVDAFLTNSRFLATHGFEAAAKLLDLPHSPWYNSASTLPRAYVALAVDSDEMTNAAGDSEDDLVVYLGQPSYSKRLLANSLLEIIKSGHRLEIYGSSAAWNGFQQEDEVYAELTSCCWKGTLATDQIGALYSRAAVVIGTTESAQRRLNMVNNRVFEAVLTARQFVCVEEERSDDELYDLVKGLPHVQLVHAPADAANAVTIALSRLESPSFFNATQFVERNSYTQRAETILSIARTLNSSSKQRRRERIAVIYDARDKSDWPWLLAYVPAIASTDDEFDFSFLPVQELVEGWCAAAAAILVRGSRAIDLALLPSTSACGAGAGGQGLPRPPAKILAFRDEDSERECGDFLAFDVVLLYEGDHFPCEHPSIAKVVGIDFDALRPSSSSESRSGKLLVESSRYDGVPEAVLKTTAIVEVRGGGLFAVLAGLAAGAVVHTDDPALAKSLADATAGGETAFREKYSLDVFSTGILRAIERSLDPPRAAAGVSIVEPADGDTIKCLTTNQCRFVVKVSLTAFVTPDDGVWCVRVDDVETSCQGDTTDHVEVPVSPSLEGKKKIHAVLRTESGVVRSSKIVGIRIIS